MPARRPPASGRKKPRVAGRAKPAPRDSTPQHLNTLHDSDRRLRALTHRTNAYIHETRFLPGTDFPDHQIIWASEGFTEIFGCTVEQYNSRGKWNRYYHPDELPATRARAAALRRGETVEADVRLCRPKADERWLHVINTPVFDPKTGEVIGVLGMGHDATERKLTDRAMEKLEQDFLKLSNHEFRRVARDLHDGLGQDLTGVALMLRSHAALIAKEFPTGRAQVEEAIALVNHAIGAVRTLARGLSPVDQEREGLAVALSGLAARSHAAFGIKVDFRKNLRSAAKIDHTVADQLYRIAQESIARGARYGRATSIAIRLTSSKKTLELTVTDDGQGMVPHGADDAGASLRIIHYRARVIGAELSVESRPSRGNRLSCKYPLA